MFDTLAKMSYLLSPTIKYIVSEGIKINKTAITTDERLQWEPTYERI